MEVKFIKNGVFTSLGKVDINKEAIVELGDDEAKKFIREGWCLPLDHIEDIGGIDSEALLSENIELRKTITVLEERLSEHGELEEESEKELEGELEDNAAFSS